MPAVAGRAGEPAIFRVASGPEWERGFTVFLMGRWGMRQRGPKDHGSGACERLRSRFQGRSTSLASSGGWGSPKRSKPAAFEFFWDDLWN